MREKKSKRLFSINETSLAMTENMPMNSEHAMVMINGKNEIEEAIEDALKMRDNGICNKSTIKGSRFSYNHHSFNL